MTFHHWSFGCLNAKYVGRMETTQTSVVTKKRRRYPGIVNKVCFGALCILCTRCSYVFALLSLSTKELYGLTAGRSVHQYSGSTGKVICLGADSNHDSVMLVKESTETVAEIGMDIDSRLFESLPTSLNDKEGAAKYRSTPSYLSLSLDEMTELASYFCDEAAFPTLQPCDYHDMYRLQQALFKRAQQKQQQLSDLKDKSSADGVREEVVVAAALIQKLLRRALGDLILIQKVESKLGPNSRKLFFPNDGFFPAGTKKKLYALQRHLKLMCTISIYAIIQFEQNLAAAMDALHRLETSIYSIRKIPDSDQMPNHELGANISTDIGGHINGQLKLQILPTCATYKAIIVGWSRQLQKYISASYKSPPPLSALRCAEQAQIVLNKMIDRAVNAPNFILTRNTFNIVLNAWAEVAKGAEAHNLLNRMNDLSSNIEISYHQNLPNQVKDIKKTDGTTNNAQTSQHLSPIRPDLLSYNIVLKAYAKEQAKIRSQGENNLLQGQNSVNGNIFSSTYESSTPCREAEKLLKHMEEISNNNSNTRIVPDRISYTCVIDALASSFECDAPLKAEAILNRMEKLYRDTRKESVRPDTIAYNSVLLAFSKFCEQNDSLHNREGADNYGERCEKMLRRMERLYNEGENPDARPDTYSYNSVMNTWANTAHVDAARRALNLLDEMERLSSSGDGRVAPNTISYNTVIKAWGRNSDRTAAHLVLDLVNEMEEKYKSGDANCKPDRVTYNSVMFALSNNAESCAAEKVEDLLNRMILMYEKHGDESLKPDLTSYNILLNSWMKARSDNACKRACELLDQMLQLQKYRIDAINPDTRSYVAVIKCISQSSDSKKARKALEVFNNMVASYQSGNKAAVPNVFAYSAVLNACAFTSGNEIERQDAMDVAVEIMARISKSRTASANHVVYASFLKACASLLPYEDARRRPMVETMFKKCCRDGQVGEVVLRQLKFAAPPDLYENLVGQYRENGEVRFRSLPVEWKRNVRERKFQFHHAK